MIDRIDDIDLLDPVERDHPLLRGCVAWWVPLPNLYGSTKYWDVIGRNHGTLTGGPTWRGDGSIQYDGSNDYITCGNAVTTRITGELSVVCNFSGSSQQNKGLVSKYDAVSPNRGYSLTTANVAATTALAFYYQSSAGSFNANQLVTSTSGILNGQNRVAVAVFKPSVSAEIFVDGVINVTKTTSVPASIAATTAAFEIGRVNNNLSNLFAGNISRAMVFNRAVDASWVSQDYEQYKRGYPDLFHRLSRTAYSFPAAPPPAITRRPFFSDWGSMC